MADVLFVSHEATITGAPFALLQFLQWLRQTTTLDIEVLLLQGGPLATRFAEVGTVTTPETLRGRSSSVVFLNSAFSALVLANETFPGSYVISRVPELGFSLEHALAADDRARLLERADRFIAVSSRVRDDLVDGFGVPGDRVATIHGFIDVGPLTPPPPPEDTATARAELGVPVDAPLVGAVGTTDWRKGADLFVQVAHLVGHGRPDLGAHFLWVGGREGDRDWARLADEIDRAGLRDSVHLAPERADPRVLQAAIDVHVSTSRDDPFPRVCLEAGALAKPIVAFDSGGVVELLAEGRGWIVPYGDVGAMAERVIGALDDPAAAAETGARLDRHVRAEHTLEASAPRVLAEIEQGLGG